MGTLIGYGFISILFSFLCSILEAVLLSVTPAFISLQEKEGKSYARKLAALKEDVDRPLIAILTLNTIAHTVGAILVGAEANKVFGADSKALFSIGGFEVTMVMFVSTLMTMLILVLSEIIPKTIGATYWKSLANISTKTLNFMLFIMKYSGILWVLRLTTKLIGGAGHGSVLSREDFSAMAAIAQEEGVFEENESTIIQNLLDFKTVDAQAIMTPRPVVILAEESDSVQNFFEAHKDLRFSRIPVYAEHQDQITGYVLKEDIYKCMANQKGGDLKLKDLMRNILTVDRQTPLPDLFEVFIKRKEHLAIVVDQYGTLSGVVTMEDVIETLLGLEIVDESDSNIDMQELARQNWKKRATRLGIIKRNEENISLSEQSESENTEKDNTKNVASKNNLKHHNEDSEQVKNVVHSKIDTSSPTV